jgi:hypothetical protein
MQAPHKLVLGNTGDALGYFIPGDEWQTGKNNNYEESVSMGKTAGDNAPRQDHPADRGRQRVKGRSGGRGRRAGEDRDGFVAHTLPGPLRRCRRAAPTAGGAA